MKRDQRRRSRPEEVTRRVYHKPAGQEAGRQRTQKIRPNSQDFLHPEIFSYPHPSPEREKFIRPSRDYFYFRTPGRFLNGSIKTVPNIPFSSERASRGGNSGWGVLFLLMDPLRAGRHFSGNVRRIKTKYHWIHP